MMNCYKTAAVVGDHMFFSLFKSRTINRRLPNTKPFLSRSQSQAAESSSEASPGQHTADKPRLRAIDLARKVRQEKARTRTEQTEPPVSAMQQRVTELKRFSLQLQNVHPNVLAKHLHKNLLYQDKDVVIINKPYGVPVRGKLRWLKERKSGNVYSVFLLKCNCMYVFIRFQIWTDNKLSFRGLRRYVHHICASCSL